MWLPEKLFRLQIAAQFLSLSFLVFYFPQAEKLMKQIGVKNVKLSEYEMSIAAHLVDPLSMHVRNCFCCYSAECTSDREDTDSGFGLHDLSHTYFWKCTENFCNLKLKLHH